MISSSAACIYLSAYIYRSSARLAHERKWWLSQMRITRAAVAPNMPPLPRSLAECHTFCFFLFNFFFSSSHLILSSLFFFSLPPGRSSDPGSHSRPFSPRPYYGSCLAFLSREDFSSSFPRRVASTVCLTHAMRSQQLIHFCFWQINSKPHQGGIQTRGSSLVAFEGYH